MRLFGFFFLVALVASLKDDGELSEVSKRSPIHLYRAALNEDRERAAEGAQNSGIMTAKELMRGPRFLFWRFSLTTATCYTSTVTSTSTTTCTLSVSSTCSGGRRKRSDYLSNQDEEIAPSNVLPVESTPAADLNESGRQARKADPYYYHSNLPFYNYQARFYGIQSGINVERPNNRFYHNNYYDYNNLEDYPYYDADDHIPAYPGGGHELVNQRRRPQQQQHIPFDETGVIDGAEQAAASFKRLFNSFSTLFSTFVLTLTTTTGTSTSFTRTTVTSTPACSAPGVFAQCPTG